MAKKKGLPVHPTWGDYCSILVGGMKRNTLARAAQRDWPTGEWSVCLCISHWRGPNGMVQRYRSGWKAMLLLACHAVMIPYMPGEVRLYPIGRKRPGPRPGGSSAWDVGEAPRGSRSASSLRNPNGMHTLKGMREHMTRGEVQALVRERGLSSVLGPAREAVVEPTAVIPPATAPSWPSAAPASPASVQVRGTTP